MARTARLVVPDLSVHIVQRGHDGRDCFFERNDYLAYLDLLAEFAPKTGCSVHAYCLMTNHVHLFLTPHVEQSCALLMKNIGQRYVQRVNARRGRSGTLWEGRFYSCLVPTERYVQRVNARRGRSGTLWEGRFYSCLVPTERYALACYRYVECNPVKPGMVSHPAEYPWSSYKANAGTTLGTFLAAHPVYLTLGTEEGPRASAYRALCEVPLPKELADDLRRATRRGYAAGTPARRRGRPWK